MAVDSGDDAGLYIGTNQGTLVSRDGGLFEGLLEP
jgi:hypothetical protein